jgi:hypothetical protein
MNKAMNFWILYMAVIILMGLLTISFSRMTLHVRVYGYLISIGLHMLSCWYKMQ